MNILTPGYEILTQISKDGVDELKRIEKIARVCYKSEDKITDDIESAKKLITNLIKNGHEAMIEHSSLSIKFYVDRGVSHELVRHRIASFAQESTRYCNYATKGGQINVIDLVGTINGDKTTSNLSKFCVDIIYEEWLEAMKDAERHYLKILSFGVSPQVARSVLPNSTKTEIIITANYREWRNFFKLRVADTAHPAMREVTRPLLVDLKHLIPVIFDDITYDGEEKYGVSYKEV